MSGSPSSSNIPIATRPGKQCCVRSTVACLPTPKPANKIQGPFLRVSKHGRHKIMIVFFFLPAPYTCRPVQYGFPSPPKKGLQKSPAFSNCLLFCWEVKIWIIISRKLKLWTFVGVCGSLYNFTRPVSLEATGFQPEICSENFYQGNWWSWVI